MREEHLKLICNNFETKSKFIDVDNWTAEVYSFGKNIRDYGFYPSFLPLNIYTDHSPFTSSDKPAPHELKSKAAVQFYHNPRMVEEFKKISTKPCYSLYSPFVFYRRKNKIEQLPNAKGTLAFPAHTTEAVDDLSDLNIYISQLKKLPKNFHPISICFHMHDINKERYKIFIDHGFDVYTAGNINDDRFSERFYNILKKFRYTTSNLIGAYTCYSVEMGIPFFIYGEDPQYYNHWDPNFEIGNYSSYKEAPKYIFAKNLFKEVTSDVSKEQKDFIEDSLGINYGVSRLKMSFILYGCFFKYLIKIKILKMFLKSSLKMIKKYTRPIRRKIRKILWAKK
jgi:hypothetical protein